MRNAILLLLLHISFYVKAQNLVIDGSFEDTISTPQIGSGSYVENYCTHWTNSIGANYFTNFSVNPDWSTPQNMGGYCQPISGNGYVGIFTFVDSFNLPRKYIIGELIDTLEINKKYRVKLNVSLADSFIFSCNNIGIYFSDTVPTYYYQNGTQLHLNLTHVPEVEFNYDLKNKDGWTTLDTTYTANGYEKYLMIGNFIPDSLSDTNYVGGNNLFSTTPNGTNYWNFAYYFIDDVSVELYDDTGIKEDGNAYSITILPNPNNGSFTIKADTLNKPTTFVIIDALGQVIDSFIITGGSTNYENDNLSNGMYFYTTISNNIVTSRGKFLIQK